jgi:hydrocephalus-inducing protein
MAPSFDISPQILDFGKVSYSFPKTERVIMTNTSSVPFRFNLRIPGDGKLNQKEFDIKPAKDWI